MKFEVEGGSSPGKPQTGERRISGRVGTRRDVVFSDYQAMGPLRSGMAVDMSAGGFCILTAYPEAVGAEIHIELQPDADRA